MTKINLIHKHTADSLPQHFINVVKTAIYRQARWCRKCTKFNVPHNFRNVGVTWFL